MYKLKGGLYMYNFRAKALNNALAKGCMIRINRAGATTIGVRVERNSILIGAGVQFNLISALIRANDSIEKDYLRPKDYYFMNNQSPPSFLDICILAGYEIKIVSANKKIQLTINEWCEEDNIILKVNGTSLREVLTLAETEAIKHSI